MTMYFSPTTLGFYPDELRVDYENSGSWPADAASISDTDYKTYQTPPPPGKILGAVNGAPAFIDAPGPDLPTAQATQNRVLFLACQQQILSGFTSSALGVAYSYASDAVDQRNILLAAQSSKGGLLSCQTATGIWSRVLHTQQQAQQVAEDFVVASDAARTKLGVLEAQIAAANSVASVQAVVWEVAGG